MLTYAKVIFEKLPANILCNTKFSLNSAENIELTSLYLEQILQSEVS
jgi:hypothetical protein